jgi:Ca2+-binding RTX toxin-like protein
MDFILGGFESDTVMSGADDDWILGDNGRFRYDQLTDDITLLGRPDVVARIDSNFLTLDSSVTSVPPNPATLDLVTTTDPTLGDDDMIYGNAGDDTIFGGTGSDRIWGDTDDDDMAHTGDGEDLIFGDHGKVYPSLPGIDSWFAGNNFFAIDTAEADGADTDGLAGDDPLGNDFEDTVFGSGGDDIILGQQDDDILFGGADDDILIGGHNVVGGDDELDGMDAAQIAAITADLPVDLALLDPSDINDINDVMDGGSGDDSLTGDNAIVKGGDFPNPRFQALTDSVMYSMTTQTLGSLLDVDVGFTPNVTYTPDPLNKRIILLDHTATSETDAATTPDAPRPFGNDVMAGNSDDDELFGQLGDDIVHGDGSTERETPFPVDAQIPNPTTPFDPSPTANPDFVIPDNQTTDPFTYFMVDSEVLVFRSPEDGSDGDDYIEGGGGNDREYGGLGQDDIIGGSSSLFGLDDATATLFGIPANNVLRPDGADLIYGGAGNPDRMARNAVVDGADSFVDARHARDADTILGDNGNIYRIVDASGNPETFNYDNLTSDGYSGTLKIIPRAVELIDYKFEYTDANDPKSLDFSGIGAGDLIFGETGDDIIHGMTGDDVIFGNSEDDDIYGEEGNDWISGGTGEDGIVGDDGLILTSRNDLTAEPLYGIAALNPEQTFLKKNDPVDTQALNAVISTPGNIQRAIINAEGDLKKTVDLLAFDAGVAGAGVNDIIYGGLNDDWIHAGAGDDAISGAEALPIYYSGDFDLTDGNSGVGFAAVNIFLQNMQAAPPNDTPDLADNPFWFDFAPYNPGEILRFEGKTIVDGNGQNGKTRDEFAWYDEFNPRRKIMFDFDFDFDTNQGADFQPLATLSGVPNPINFLLNFDPNDPGSWLDDRFSDEAKLSDGDDKMFGDLDNDWMVGGSGRDHMYGGRGDNLLNMDDDHDSGPGGKVGPHDPPPDQLDNTQSDEFQA